MIKSGKSSVLPFTEKCKHILASWCNESNSISRSLDLAGCQGKRYSSVAKTKHTISPDDILSFIRSFLHQPRDFV
ncbi:hypothetical protein OROGR_032695 [Orobanche gracilis]